MRDSSNDRRAESYPDRRDILLGVGVSALSVLVPGAVVAQEDDADDADEGADEANGEADANGDEEDGADESEDGEEEDDDEEDEDDEEDANGGTETVVVGPGGDNVFEPESLTIEPGTTVEFIWDSDNHNVNPTEQPDDADWEGHEPIEDDGFEFESTFEVEGEYEYVCDPHVGVGMIGEITVSADADEAADNGEAQQLVSNAAMTLLIATTLSLVAVLSLSYAFLKFGGSNPQ